MRGPVEVEREFGRDTLRSYKTPLGWAVSCRRFIYGEGYPYRAWTRYFYGEDAEAKAVDLVERYPYKTQELKREALGE